MIRITDDYVIDCDDMTYTIEQDMHSESVDNKTGKTRHNYKVIGYYTTLYKALEGMRDFLIRKSLSESEMSLGEACRVVLEANNKFAEMYKEQTGGV